MILSAALLACAVNVAPITLEAIVRVERGATPWRSTSTILLDLNRRRPMQRRLLLLGGATSLLATVWTWASCS